LIKQAFKNNLLIITTISQKQAGFFMKMNNKKIIRFSIFSLTIIVAGIFSFRQISLENRPAGGYDEQMWTGASILATQYYFTHFQKSNILPERWFSQYAQKYGLDLKQMPKEELRWYDDAMWTFGWKAPNFGKYLMGASILFFGENVNPNGYFYEANNPAHKGKWPGNYAPKELVYWARFSNAILTILTIAALFIIGWYFFNFLTGLAASAYLTFNSSFISVSTAAGLDAPSILFSTASMMSLFFFIRYFKEGNFKRLLISAIFSGISIALAVSSKLNAGLVVYITVISALLILTNSIHIYLTRDKNNQKKKKNSLIREAQKNILISKIKTIFLAFTAMGALTYFIFVSLNPIFRSQPLTTKTIIEESVDHFFTLRAKAKKTSHIKNSWLESFKLALKRNFIKTEKAFLGTFGKLIPITGMFLDALFFFSGLLLLFIKGAKRFIQKKELDIALFLSLWAIVILYGNIDFMWIDFNRYHIAFYYSNALVIGFSFVYFIGKIKKALTKPNVILSAS
jgi:hypothetical protein